MCINRVHWTIDIETTKSIYIIENSKRLCSNIILFTLILTPGFRLSDNILFSVSAFRDHPLPVKSENEKKINKICSLRPEPGANLVSVTPQTTLVVVLMSVISLSCLDLGNISENCCAVVFSNYLHDFFQEILCKLVFQTFYLTLNTLNNSLSEASVGVRG